MRKSVGKRNAKFLADKPMGSAMVQLAKTHFVPRNSGNRTSEKLSKYFLKLCKEKDIHASYDVVYGNAPHDLRYSEFFGGIGGIQVGACDGNMIRRMFHYTYDVTNNKDYSDLLNLSEVHDKYILHDYDITPMNAVVILPGSNLLEDVVDKEKLNAAMLLGARVKCHPLTHPKHIQFLKEQYGANTVIPVNYSGYNCILNANVVFATGTSELGLYSMLLNKQVISISTGRPVGGYADAFGHTINAPNQKEELNLLLNNPASGIFLPVGDWKKAMKDWFDIYLKMLSVPSTEVNVPKLSRYSHYV